MVDVPVHEEIITPHDAADAIALAKNVNIDMIGLQANAIYLLDPGGHIVWSIRLADVPIDEA